MSIRTTLQLLAAMSAAACTQQVEWTSHDPAALDPARSAQRAAAETARDRLATTLLGELTTALGTGGPAAAIEVCRTRAPAIAAEVTATTGVRIGRCATLLRNPDNAPPAWAAAHVAANVPMPAVFVASDGRLGMLSPIRIQPLCVQCHGSEDSLDPAVKAALQQHYPDDRATGFAAGDLRGWFWAEVKPAS